MHKLTATQVKQAKPKSKQYKLADGGSLYLLVKTNGHKYWRYDYAFGGKRKTLSIGTYPALSLRDTRLKHQEAIEKIREGIDPSEQKQAAKLTRHLAAEDSFKAISLEWFETKMRDKSESHQKRTMAALENDLFPKLGIKPISQISSPELLATLKKIEARGAIETAKRARQTTGQIFRYAIATGRAINNPSEPLKDALKTPKKKHHPTIIEPEEIGKLMVMIDNYTGTPIVKAALQLSPLLFQRPGEIRHMEWNEINWEDKRWEIPAEKMKMRQPHIVPISEQALGILVELKLLTEHRGKYVFPSQKGASRCLSDNSVRGALRTLGYSNERIVPHGFRAMARTLLDEVLGYRVEWIEAQLAHAVKDANGRAYNRTSYLKDRTAMMQAWADYLTRLKEASTST